GDRPGTPGPGDGAAVLDQGPRPGAGPVHRPVDPGEEPRQPARGQRAGPRQHLHRAAPGGRAPPPRRPSPGDAPPGTAGGPRGGGGGRGGGRYRREGSAMTPAGARVLVVDDDVDTCRNLSDILADLGYQVDTAHDGPQALELVRRRPYDVALLDLRMPGMDGL